MQPASQLSVAAMKAILSMFRAYLINDPLSDPGMYAKIKHRGEALLFDLGELHNLPPRKILKISHVFVTHTHMDHFIGFDHLLRICLGRNAHVSLYGPPGFIKNVEGKLAAYTWNLVPNYTNDFNLTVTEVHERHTTTINYRCRNAFLPDEQGTKTLSEGILVDRQDFTVQSVVLDHRVPCLAFSLTEKMHINIMKNALDDMGLMPGKWLGTFKDGVRRGDPDDTPVTAWYKDNDRGVMPRTLPLGELKENIIKITAGRKISYIADALYSDDNARKIITLAMDSDTIFIEAPFLDEDAAVAADKYHLTARQAGILAKRACAKNLCIFHISPKYKGREHLLIEEAQRAFKGWL